MNPVLLLVEDNEMNRDMLTRRLERKGFQVLSAMDGPSALEVLRKQPPDLVLMDMSLPILDGWETTRQIKADPETAQIPVIALTAHAMLGEREKALKVGCSDYETKPVNFPLLLEKIHTLLARADQTPSGASPDS